MNLSLKRPLRRLKRLAAALTFIYRLDWAWRHAGAALEWLEALNMLE